jgi:hypothetical protein
VHQVGYLQRANLSLLADESTQKNDGDEKWHYQIWLTD